eukprot:6714554-Alexandrium_andersonii.AAC.1
MVVLLAQIGYRERVGGWYRPVVLRPLTSSDPGCRLRMASLAAEAAAQCFVLTLSLVRPQILGLRPQICGGALRSAAAPPNMRSRPQR